MDIVTESADECSQDCGLWFFEPQKCFECVHNKDKSDLPCEMRTPSRVERMERT
jgi:hypothetical protein